MENFQESKNLQADRDASESSETMGYFQELKNECKTRWDLVCGRGPDKKPTTEVRVFAGLELFCFPVSFLTVFVLLPAQILLVRFGGWAPPAFVSAIIDVLLSAAIGYITNYIAIEMLFKPYEENKKHFLSIVTFGYWKQGLIPKNKNKIGAEMGEQIEKKLLNPESVADEICEIAMQEIRDPAMIETLRNAIQTLLHDNEAKIIAYLVPQIEQSIMDAINANLSRDSVMAFWQTEILPQLSKKESREFIAREIVDALKRRSPQMTEMLKKEIHDYLKSFLDSKLPFGAETLANGFVSFINWKNIEARLTGKLEEESVLVMLQDELGSLFDRLNGWVHSPEGVSKVDSFVDSIRQKLRSYLSEYLKKELPSLANGIIDSESLWNWVEKDMIPAAQPQLEELIRRKGKDCVVQKLNFAQKVASAVEKQNVKEFHGMINKLAAQHLGAIQVLGYFLGLLIGLVQLLH